MTWGRRRPTIPLGSYRRLLVPRQLVLTGDEAHSHIHVQGKTGSGKSRWLASLCRNLLKAGSSFTLLDPHGDLAKLVFAQLVADGFFDQADAYDKLLYLDIPEATRRRRYLRFNCLKQPYDTHTLTRFVLDAVRRAYPTLSAAGVHAAPAFEQIVTAGVHVLVDNGLPFPLLRPLLLPTRKAWRDQLLTRVDDRMIRSFFHDELDQWDGKLRDALEGSTMRRLFLLLYSPVLRYALGARDNLLEYRSILQNNRSVIVNLAIQDPDAKRLLGCLLTVFGEQGALSRADVPAGERYGTHYIILDEAQLFVAQSGGALSDMLSQTRKYRTFVVFSHQTIGQIPFDMRSGLQNVEVEILFRAGRDDAERHAKTIGAVDPLSVKHTVADEQAAEKTHPAFYSLHEQWEGWTRELIGLPQRMAFIKHPNGSVTKVHAPHLPDPVVDRRRLAAIGERYLNECFTPAPQTDAASPAEETIWEQETSVVPVPRWVDLDAV